MFIRYEHSHFYNNDVKGTYIFSSGWWNDLLFEWWFEYQTILVYYWNGDLNSGQFVH